MTVPCDGTIYHSVAVKGAYMKTITKVNGNWFANRVFKIYDPGSGIRYEAFDWVGHNAITIFSIWK